ncbi:MAG: glycosyltransferase, partial [Alphaproteobacteria bacterium GM202ARS2]|nr:glycosyltransferase [Alphaproteobacteria bacterium GM202ARS2]
HNQGPAVSRNTAIQHARGHYIALQDDDDISLPQRLNTQRRYLEKKTHIDMVASLMATFNEQRGVQPDNYGKNWRSYARKLPSINNRTSHIKVCIGTLLGKSHLFKAHPYRPFFQRNEDYDVLMRCSEHANIETINHVLYHYRKDETVSSQTNKDHAFLMYQYHCLVWASAYHRHKGWQDPVCNAKSINDAINNFHPQFKKQAAQGLKKITEECAEALLTVPQQDVLEQTTTFVSDFAGPQLVPHLLDHTTAKCLLRNQTDKLHVFTTDKDPLQRAAIRQHIRSISLDEWCAHLRYCIRHNHKQEFIRLLQLSYRSYNGLKLLRISPKILFACLRRGRFSFILPFLQTCMRIKP